MKHYDVIVAGFGTAGTIAAIAAAREGAAVLALERGHYAGGIHTGGGVASYYIQRPIGLMKELDETIHAEKEHDRDSSYVPGELNKQALERIALDSGVELRYGAAVFDVLREGDRITGVRFVQDGQVLTVSARTVIDATADAILCQRAQVPMECGRESDHIFMPFTDIMLRCYDNISDLAAMNFDAGRIDQYREPEYSQTLLRSHLVHLYEDYRELRDLIVPGDLVGVREGFRIIPEGTPYTLADVLDGSDDAVEPIGYVWSNLDTHANDMPLEDELIQDWMIGASMWGIQLWFPVPRNAMHPRGIRGLLVAGRHLGVGHNLNYAQRMNPLMGMLGAAAGYSAAIAARKGVDADAVPYADFAGKLGLPEDPLAYNRKLWNLTPDEVRSALDSDEPGIAMWTARRQVPAATLQEWYNSAAPGSRLRRHTAMALALKGDASGVEELRAMVRERDPYAPKHSRKYNHCRGYVSLYFLGRLADPECIALAADLLKGNPPAEHAYEYASNAVAAVIKVGDRHPEMRNSCAELLRSVLEDPAWRISSRLKGTADTMKRMDALFRCAGGMALKRWGIPNTIREALIASGADPFERDLAARLNL